MHLKIGGIVMTQKDKELLLKDICARLPYDVKINENTQGDFTVIGLTTERVFTTCETEGCHNDFPIECVKPYLFPLSSMTEEQEKEYNNLNCYELGCFPHSEEALDFLTKNHFDYRYLIEKGLAIDATGLGIY